MVTRPFQVMAKPAGARCNLDCRYCYYLRAERLYPGPEAPRMPEDLLAAYIVQHIEACPGPVVHFEWHGGEPTTLGLPYFRRIVELQRAHRPPGRRITNGLQTNGTLLDQEWGRFLGAEGFFVGLSLDGPPELHDGYRVTRGGRPTHAQVMRGFRILERHRVPCDVLCVVHDQNVRAPLGLYRFFREAGVRHLQFLPLVERAGDGVSARTVPAEGYGEFLCAIFDEWRRQDVERVSVQIFDEAARPALGLDHALCIFRETCGDVPVVEHTGDFYACDHFVDRAHRRGNIGETPLAALLESPAQRAFGEAKRTTLPRWCRACDVLALCNGGCPKDRILRTPDGEPGLNYLCAGLRRFFRETRAALGALAARWRGARSAPAAARRSARPAQALPRPGRNDACPCGSGQKYKRCCMAREGRA